MRLHDLYPGLATFVIGCSDRFGDYGIVGFAVVDQMVRDAPPRLDRRLGRRRVEPPVDLERVATDDLERDGARHGQGS